MNKIAELVKVLDCHHYEDDWLQLVVHLLKTYITPRKQNTLNLTSCQSIRESFSTVRRKSSPCLWDKSPWRSELDLEVELEPGTNEEIVF